MQPFTNRELYIMNGGNKLYIYKDGFGNVYEATPEEEAEWAREIVATALAKIDTADNSVDLMNAIENLRFHQYPGLDDLLSAKLDGAGPVRKRVFVIALWKTLKPEKSAEIVYQDLVQHKTKWLQDTYPLLEDMNSRTARLFMLACLQGTDDELAVKATVTIGRWAYSGMPALRQHNLLGILQPENRDQPRFRDAIEELRSIFQINPV